MTGPRKRIKTLGSHATDAELCRINGWTVGTQIVGDEGDGPTVIEITALGQSRVLAFLVSHRGDMTVPHDETPWTLRYREWERVQ